LFSVFPLIDGEGRKEKLMKIIKLTKKSGKPYYGYGREAEHKTAYRKLIEILRVYMTDAEYKKVKENL